MPETKIQLIRFIDRLRPLVEDVMLLQFHPTENYVLETEWCAPLYYSWLDCFGWCTNMIASCSNVINFICTSIFHTLFDAIYAVWCRNERPEKCSVRWLVFNYRLAKLCWKCILIVQAFFPGLMYSRFLSPDIHNCNCYSDVEHQRGQPATERASNYLCKYIFMIDRRRGRGCDDEENVEIIISPVWAIAMWEK